MLVMQAIQKIEDLPAPGDTVTFEDEPGVIYVVAYSRIEGTDPVARIFPMGHPDQTEDVLVDWK
jgi:hypothetical protein